MASVDLYALTKEARAVNNRQLRAEGYSGKNKFHVFFGGSRMATVFAGDAVSALWTAAKHWGMDPRKSEVHQNCRVRKC